MTDRPETTRVNIYGREYSIRGEGDPAYIAEIAHFLDMRMRQMTENVSMTSTAKVAILASLNITDELFSKIGQLEEVEDSHQLFLASLASRIDEVLNKEVDSTEHKKHTQQESVTNTIPIPPILQKSSSSSGKEQ